MKTATQFVLAMILVAWLVPFAAADDYSGNYYIRLSYESKSAFKDALYDFNTVYHYDVAGVDLQKLTVDLIVPESEYSRLKGIAKVDVLRDPDSLKSVKVDPQYIDPGELTTMMAQFAATYPSITHLISIGQTEEGRDIWAIKISDNPTIEEDEFALLFNGQHHAREVMCAEVCTDMIDYLCSNYGSDPDVTAWVDSLEIWVIPIVNQDGVNWVFTQYDMWRKDRHNNGGGVYGIDPNRNYPAFWGSCDGSSGTPSSDTYRGAYPGESGCVSHMMPFAETIRPVIDLSYHTYSELVIYPLGCDGEVCSEHEMVSSIGQGLAGVLERDNGTMGYSPGTAWELLYSVDGGDVDWYYTELGTYPFVIEINSASQGFLPSYSTWRDVTVDRMRPGWQFLLNRVTGPSVTGLVTDACTGTPLDATFYFQEFPLDPDDLPRTTDEFGRYFKMAVPGEYHLSIAAIGYAPVVLPITITGQQLQLDVPLVPNGSYGLYVSGHSILDPTGDNDGVIDPGETVAIEVALMSVGNTTNVQADLSTSDPYVTIDTGHAVFGSIPDGGTGSSQPPHFVITVDPMCPTEHPVTFSISITADQTLCADSGTIIEKISNYVYECPIYEELMDDNPGFAIDNTGTGGWAFGVPSVGPGTPHTGSSCYGTNLTGDYGDNGNFNLTWGPIDCSAIADTELTFWRWLQTESGYDTCYVQVSNDNATWNNAWAGYAMDTSWTDVTYDISDTADGEPQVWIRWRLTSDSNTTEYGFYVDDVSICGYTLPPDVPRLRYDYHFIDDSSGNNDGEINAGETIGLTLVLFNSGTDATGVTATLSTDNPHVNITIATASFPDINQNYTGTSLTDFVFTVSPEASNGEEIDFHIDWFTNEFVGTAFFTEMVVAPNLEFNSVLVTDPMRGDGDGILDPGESAQLVVSLINTGTGTAQNISAILSSNHPEWISFGDNESDFENIAAGATGMTVPPHFTVTASSSTPDHTIIIFTLSITADGHVASDTFPLEITYSNFALRYQWDMDTNPGWTTEGQWAWGVPQGNSGDPSSGATGDNVYGYNLAGSYANSLPETYLTSTAINCAALNNVEVHFMRWLGVESSTWDHASFRVSNNGSTWTTIWDHSGSSFTDTSWQAMSYDISAVADGQSTVYLRWVMGTTDSSVVYCGWNVDDVEIWGETEVIIPTPTPTPDCPHHGDANLSGDVTAGDAQLAFMIALGTYTPIYEEWCQADCNGNGEITAGDAQGIFLKALGMGLCADDDPFPAIRKQARMTAIQSVSKGFLQLSDSYLTDDNLIAVDIIVNNADVPIDVFTITLEYDTGTLTFIDCATGELDPGWVEFGCNEPETGTVLMAGYAIADSGEPLTRGINLATLYFKNGDNPVMSEIRTPVRILETKDDLLGFRFVN